MYAKWRDITKKENGQMKQGIHLKNKKSWQKLTNARNVCVGMI